MKCWYLINEDLKSSIEVFTYVFIVLRLHMKTLHRVQAPIIPVQVQETSFYALLAYVTSLTVRKRQQHNSDSNCSQCQSSLKPVCIETVWFWVWVFSLFFVPLQSSNPIYLIPVVSLLMTLQHGSWHLCILSQRVSLCFIDDDQKCKPYQALYAWKYEW